MTTKAKSEEVKTKQVDAKDEAKDVTAKARTLETVLQNTSGVSPELTKAAKDLIAAVGGSGLPK